MAKEVFEQHKAEMTFLANGKKSRQVMSNLKETVESEKVLDLAQLFDDLALVDVTLEETATIKRVRHENS